MNATAADWDGPPPLAVVVDLDDTLYPHADHLAGAAAAVAAAAAAAGLDGDRVHAALRRELAAGSDTGGTIDRALLASGVPAGRLPQLVPGLVAAFTRHEPAVLEPHAGVVDALVALGRVVPVGCLTDGNPVIQAAKLAATGLGPLLPEVLVTDSLGGRPTRKPAPDGLVELARRLEVPAHRVLVIGDRPGKDVAVAAAVGARAIRVRQGEYAAAPDVPRAWATTDSFPAATVLALTVIDA
ncbi:HAD hydrolase-like protein [Modestobacter sp. I12A-02628]|uniref:HAD family hydrolase n=1 Tax=Goekera deserti TaxID=2497753 RepID=A0A7K3WHN7_9ACTN|nr:HAD family hydrolase [Goekera deserti]MPQ97728.1 HAD hydrolase-like protein [Goekera deserti]NDI48373.1 HAD hydrolase-like protein [Goekera deserti]NEL55974.1 HAD family hydrolase [Goekera deserti]